MPPEDNHQYTLDAAMALGRLDERTRSERQRDRWATFALGTVCGIVN